MWRSKGLLVLGKTFHKLIVLEEKGRDNYHNILWLCKCVCGNYKVVTGSHLRSGHTKSCGCTKRMQTIHGGSYTPEYTAWLGMKSRCYNSNHNRYIHYGGRGITVCDRWKDSFENFLADMGKRPSENLSIDRIDNDGNYEPSNCRWATGKVQILNRKLRCG